MGATDGGSASLVDDILSELEKLVHPAQRAEFEAQMRPQLNMAKLAFGDAPLLTMLADVKAGRAAIEAGDRENALRLAAKYGQQARVAQILDERAN